MKVVHIIETEDSAKKPSSIPLFESLIQAGFPSPADDEAESALDLNELIVRHPAATFFIRVSGASMIDANIFDGDILVVDRALEPSNGKIIVARVGSDFTVKRLSKKGNTIQLLAENPSYPPITISDEAEFEVWGVVSYIIHKAK